MNIATTFQTAAAVTSVPVLIPGRKKLIGVQLSSGAAGDVAGSLVNLQASLQGVYQNSSGVGGSPMYGILAQLTYFATLGAAFANQTVFVPLAGIIVADRLYVHAGVGAGMTCYFTAVFHFLD